MRFIARAAIALLAGVGARLVGFWGMWQTIRGLLGQNPGIGWDGWLLAAIFLPGVVVSLAVFRTVSKDAWPRPS
jgi:hypothetical protein